MTAANAPVISLIGANPLNWEATTAYSDPGATCTDNNGAGANIPVGANFSLDTTALNVNTVGLQTVTWNCTGASATTSLPRSVNVQDTTPPALSLAPVCDTGANAISQVADGTDPTPVPTSIDALDGDISAAVVLSGGPVVPNPVFNSTLSQTFNLGFTSTDLAGNSSVASCNVVLGNPLPVATLNGNSTVVLNPGVGFVDPLASCADFVDGPLPDATPDMVIDNLTPNGNYTITYSCTNSASMTGTTTRSVIVGVAFSAASDSGSNFTMLDPTGKFVGGATDIFFSWDGSLYNDPVNQTVPNMFMGSAQPQPFFGFPWVAHDIRAFGPGNYVIPTSRGNTLTLDIGPDQIGTHILFDWNQNDDIDVVVVWDLNGVFVGSVGVANDNGAKGQSFSLASVDPVVGDSDIFSGVPMADGPFAGFNANFNIQLTPQFALPDTSAFAAQNGSQTTIVSSGGGNVTVTATVNPDVNGVFTYGATGFTYDWSASDAALLGVEVAGPSTSGTFVYDPTTLPNGASTATVKVTDNSTGLTSMVSVPMQIASAADGDADADGVPDSQDLIDNTTVLNRQQGVASDATNFVIESSAGTLKIGDLATAVGVVTGQYGAAVSDTQIGTADPFFTNSCVGNCYSFTVSGLAQGAAVDVILPLGTAIPNDGAVRKFINGTWRDFVVTGGNSIMTAPGAAGDCSTPGAFSAGVTPGNFCLKLTIVDGGPNDADGVANGVIRDPVGVGSGAAVIIVPGPVASPSKGGGCSVAATDIATGKHSEWWLVGGFIALLGLGRFRRSNKRNLEI